MNRTMYCLQCFYEAPIPDDMTPGEYAAWHNWSGYQQTVGNQTQAYCSQCHARVGA
jgi:hypothetical protein